MSDHFEKKLEPSKKLVVFEDKHIRRIFHKGEWYFSIVDVIAVLINSPNPRRYWSDIKIQLVDNEGFIQLYEKIVQLKLEAPDGKRKSQLIEMHRVLPKTALLQKLVAKLQEMHDEN